ncbi:Toxoplasma gondii family E protein, partial [Toxoplasma gondii GT1]
RAGARPSLPSRPPPKPPLPQISKVGFGASGTPVQRGASQGGTPSGSEKRDGGEPSKDVKGQGEDAGQPGASGGPLGGAGGGGRRPGDDERDDDKRKKGKGSSSGGGEKKKEEQEKKAKKERDQREEAKKESKPVDGREARGKEVKQGGGGLSSDSGKGSTGEGAGKKKAKKDRGRRAIEETVGDVTDAVVTSEATGGVPKEAEPQKDGEDRGVHGGGRGGEGPGSAGATETGDGLQHDSGGIGSGSEDRDKSRSETAAREKQVSKRQKSSGGRRKKKGASVAPQTGQTTTGEAPRSAVDSEGGRAGPLAASDKNKAGTDEGGRDAKGDEDGEAATAGPRAGAQHTGEHGGETEVVGETVKVAEADEEGSDAAAQREALRTGARPKTSSAAGRRKQKVKEQHAEQAESVSTRVSAAAEVQEVASRGRARHRTRAPDTRAGTGGSHKGVKASLGPSDGKGGQDGDVTSAGSVRKGPRSGGVDILSVSLNISFKTTAVLAEYRRELESLAMMAGAMELLDKAVNGKVSLEEIDAHDFTVLSQAVILEAEITFKLDSLHEVANGLINLVTGKKQAATKEEAATPAEAVSTSVTETSRGTEENGGVFEEVLGNIQDALSVARQRGVALLSTELRLRAHAIEKYVLPELPAIDLPPLPHQSGYDPKSKDVLHTSGGQSLPVAIPSTAVFILKDCLSQWKVTAESGALSSLEERWWTPPSDPEEAKRQKERTASAFQMAASLVSLRVLHEISRRWDLSDAIRRSDDPRVRRMLHETSGLLTSAIKAEVLASRLAVEDYANLIRETARANVRRPDEAWRPLSTNQHAPEIRAAMDASDKEAGAHAPVYERRPDVLDGTETHEKDGGDESTMQ